MALDTIDKVLEAEKQADSAEKDAVVEADRIVAKAEDDAIGLKEDLSKQARAEADEAINGARKKADELIKQAEAEAEKTVSELRADTASKEEKAIKLIIDELTA